MSYTFDLEAAIDQIATMEAAINTPAPGIVTAYGYNENPAVITNVSLFPAVVHVPLGPANFEQVVVNYSWGAVFEVYSRVLFIEARHDKYPADENANNKLWLPIVEKFVSPTGRSDLVTASGAFSYECVFLPNSYGVRPWPPVKDAPNVYWSLQYTHRFYIYGG